MGAVARDEKNGQAAFLAPIRNGAPSLSQTRNGSPITIPQRLWPGRDGSRLEIQSNRNIVSGLMVLRSAFYSVDKCNYITTFTHIMNARKSRIRLENVVEPQLIIQSNMINYRLYHIKQCNQAPASENIVFQRRKRGRGGKTSRCTRNGPKKRISVCSLALDKKRWSDWPIAIMEPDRFQVVKTQSSQTKKCPFEATA